MNGGSSGPRRVMHVATLLAALKAGDKVTGSKRNSVGNRKWTCEGMPCGRALAFARKQGRVVTLSRDDGTAFAVLK